MTISGDPGISLDSKPPHPIGDTAGLTYAWTDLKEQESGNSTLLAPWTGTGTPTRAQCKLWTATNSLPQVSPVVPDMQICIKTNQGRYGLLHIDSSNGFDQLSLTATIWGP